MAGEVRTGRLRCRAADHGRGRHRAAGRRRRVGEIEVRGPWITGSYYKEPAPDRFSPDGWLRTGDVATLDDRGFIQISDRTKDVIKSGGEWISSVELENQVMANPDVFEAAVIGVPDEQYDERPLVVVVPGDGHKPEPSEILEFLAPSAWRGGGSPRGGPSWTSSRRPVSGNSTSWGSGPRTQGATWRSGLSIFPERPS